MPVVLYFGARRRRRREGLPFGQRVEGREGDFLVRLRDELPRVHAVPRHVAAVLPRELEAHGCALHRLLLKDRVGLGHVLHRGAPHERHAEQQHRAPAQRQRAAPQLPGYRFGRAPHQGRRLVLQITVLEGRHRRGRHISSGGELYHDPNEMYPRARRR